MNRELAREVYKSLHGISKLLDTNFELYKSLRYKIVDLFSIADVYYQYMIIKINGGDYTMVININRRVTIYKRKDDFNLTLYYNRPKVNNLRMILNEEYLTYCILRIYKYLSYEAQNK